ncbi:tetratricopeptide repeat protein [Synechococcus sp. AH-551-E11]|nr:class I SAM-dependent methyltransferase [Synechococcus sp. AH-551-E11]MDB4616498.1 tetratricopeptide repeat protein [Synechococcus sp. AH-551-E11]
MKAKIKKLIRTKNSKDKKKRKEEETLWEEALSNHIKGDLERAKILYEKAIQLGCSNENILINLGVINENHKKSDESIRLYKKAIKLNPNNSIAHTNLGRVYKDLGLFDQAIALTLKSIELNPSCSIAHMNLGGIYRDKNELNLAITSTLNALKIDPNNPIYHMNLGGLYKEAENFNQALASTLNSLRLKPNNSTALMNLGAIYKDLEQFDKALDSTIKSLKLNPDNPIAYKNLGAIYKDLNELDLTIDSTLKYLKLRPGDPSALSLLKEALEQINLNSKNADNVTKAYELIINLNNVSQSKLTRIFIQSYLPIIQEASKTVPIISEDNNSLKKLAGDWRLRKTLTLIIPTHKDIENLFAGLRKELLTLAANKKEIPVHLKSLTEALAIQCYLNEYVYTISKGEEIMLDKLIIDSKENQDLFNQYLAIIACYIPIHKLKINKDWLIRYPKHSEESKILMTTQLKEPEAEKNIKDSVHSEFELIDLISRKVEEMYEENPYPRYRNAEYTEISLKKKASHYIKLESTRKNIKFPEILDNNHTGPRILIAGCGTGNQVINASRYKNAHITAIDLSSNSLAYAIRKTKEYGMDNVTFKKMDILQADVGLKDRFDIIECSGVLHHMEEPTKGLAILNHKLNPGGYMKIALYSEIARQDIVKARKIIKELGLKSTPDGIRKFRELLLKGEFKEISNLYRLRRDFYSLSECRDLCFHIKEHRYTTELIEQYLATEGLIFCGFILQNKVKIEYRKQFATDKNMTSLQNWHVFEKNNPLTFISMYQFWVYKNL